MHREVPNRVVRTTRTYAHTLNAVCCLDNNADWRRADDSRRRVEPRLEGVESGDDPPSLTESSVPSSRLDRAVTPSLNSVMLAISGGTIANSAEDTVSCQGRTKASVNRGWRVNMHDNIEPPGAVVPQAGPAQQRQ